MDTAFFRKIARHKYSKDIRKALIEIGKARCLAEKQHGFIKYRIHAQASFWERQLTKALEA